MKNKLNFSLYLGMAILVIIGCAGNLKKAKNSDSGQRIEILFLGHDSKHHDSERYASILTLPLFQEGINLSYTEDLNELNSENLRDYDGILLYANHVQISPEQEQALKEFVEGGKALIPVHSASYMFHNSDWYIDAVGAQFESHDYGTFTADIVKPEHPVMEGIKEFETWDETYVHHKINPDMTVLMERVEDNHREPWTWVREQGDGKVFYTAYGHDERTWENPNFHELLINGILWAVNDKAIESLKKLEIPTPVFENANIPNYEKKDPAPKFQHALSPEESQKLTKVPVDFELKLFASEPEIVNPIAMAWDRKGRLFVIETVDYPNQIRTDTGEGDDVIKILEDTDGDGRADKVTVFADNLNIPTSLTFANGGVIVAQAPHFLFLKDTDGDDRADVRKEIITGWGKGDTHAGPSNLKYGLDNKIWGVLGYSGFNGIVDGERLSFGQGIYRFDPNGENLQYMGRTSNNTWGLGFSEEFDIFISTANGLHSAYFAMPNKFVKRAIVGGNGNTVHRIDTHYEMPHVTPYLRQVDWHGGYTAAAGHNLYTARNFPKEYWNRAAFVNEPTGRVIHQVFLEREGSGYTEENGFNLLASADEWFAPVHTEVGPDGAVWVLDWYNFIIQHNPTPRGFETGEGNAYVNPWRDRGHGRIYRVVWKDAEPYEPIKLSKEDPQGLIEGLNHDNMFWRTTAQRLIVESQNKSLIPQLYEIINDQSVDKIGLNSPAVHALWTLHGLGVLDGSNQEAIAVVEKALTHPAAGVRQNAVKVLPKTENSLQAIVEAGLINDPDLKTRLAAVLTVAEMPPSREVGEILYKASQLEENSNDRYLPQAFLAAVLTHKEGFLEVAPEVPEKKADSLLTLPQRIVKSMGEEHYVLDRWSPILFPPDVTGKEIVVSVEIGPSDEGNLKGLIVAQGNQNNGYALYVQDGKLNWLLKQDGESYKAISAENLPKERFDVTAKLLKDGLMTISIDNEIIAKAKAPSLFSKPFDDDDVRVGYVNERSKVGDYPEDFRFRGDLDRDGVLELAKPKEGSEIPKEKEEEIKVAESVPSEEAPGVTIEIKTVEHEMDFDKETFTVKAGQKVTLIFENPDFMQHNLVISKPGTFEIVGAAADELARDPQGAQQNYVPDIPQVIIATKLVNPEGRAVLEFTAPEKPGEYPFVCTVPGHWRLMNGTMIVE